MTSTIHFLSGAVVEVAEDVEQVDALLTRAGAGRAELTLPDGNKVRVNAQAVAYVEPGRTETPREPPTRAPVGPNRPTMW